MTTLNLIRWGGLAAMAAGVLNLLDSIFEPLPWLTAFSAMVTVLALTAIYAVQSEASGRLGLAGYLLAIGGYILLGAGASRIAFVAVGATLGGVGLVLLALGSLSARVFPRWVPGLWLAAVVIGLPSLFLASLGRTLEISAGAAVALGLAGAGYVLWSSGPRLAVARTSAATG